MKKDDPFGFDMSVSSSKKKNPRGRRGMSGASETSTRVCDHEGCEEAGKYRAPKSPDVLDDYYWFCQQHVREYNLKWNFFDTTSDAEFAAHMAQHRVSARPPTPFNRTLHARSSSPFSLSHPLPLFPSSSFSSLFLLLFSLLFLPPSVFPFPFLSLSPPPFPSFFLFLPLLFSPSKTFELQRMTSTRKSSFEP